MKMESLRKSKFHVSGKEMTVEIAPRLSTILTTLDVLSRNFHEIVRMSMPDRAENFPVT